MKQAACIRSLLYWHAPDSNPACFTFRSVGSIWAFPYFYYFENQKGEGRWLSVLSSIFTFTHTHIENTIDYYRKQLLSNVFDHYRKELTNLSKSTTISKTSLIIIENS